MGIVLRFSGKYTIKFDGFYAKALALAFRRAEDYRRAIAVDAAGFDRDGAAVQKVLIRAVCGRDADPGAFCLQAEHAHKTTGGACALHDGDVLLVVCFGAEIVLRAKKTLDSCQLFQKRRQVLAACTVDRLFFKEARKMIVFEFLPGVKKRRALQEIASARMSRTRRRCRTTRRCCIS